MQDKDHGKLLLMFRRPSKTDDREGMLLDESRSRKYENDDFKNNVGSLKKRKKKICRK